MPQAAETTQILAAVHEVKADLGRRIDGVKSHVENHDELLRGDPLGETPGLVEVVRRLSARFSAIIWLLSVATAAVVAAAAVDVYTTIFGG